MTLTIDLTPTEEASLYAVARKSGIAPADVLKQLVREHLPLEPAASPPEPSGNDTTLALLQSWIDAAPTDPEEIRVAEEDLNEFMTSINAERKRAGARILYPEAE